MINNINNNNNNYPHIQLDKNIFTQYFGLLVSNGIKLVPKSDLKSDSKTNSVLKISLFSHEIFYTQERCKNTCAQCFQISYSPEEKKENIDNTKDNKLVWVHRGPFNKCNEIVPNNLSIRDRKKIIADFRKNVKIPEDEEKKTLANLLLNEKIDDGKSAVDIIKKFSRGEGYWIDSFLLTQVNNNEGSQAYRIRFQKTAHLRSGNDNNINHLMSSNKNDEEIVIKTNKKNENSVKNEDKIFERMKNANLKTIAYKIEELPINIVTIGKEKNTKYTKGQTEHAKYIKRIAKINFATAATYKTYEGDLSTSSIFNISEKIALATSLIETLVKLRDLKIIHGDLKPENILYKKEKEIILAICDWQHSKLEEQLSNFIRKYSNENIPDAVKILGGTPEFISLHDPKKLKLAFEKALQLAKECHNSSSSNNENSNKELKLAIDEFIDLQRKREAFAAGICLLCILNILPNWKQVFKYYERFVTECNEAKIDECLEPYNDETKNCIKKLLEVHSQNRMDIADLKDFQPKKRTDEICLYAKD